MNDSRRKFLTASLALGTTSFFADPHLAVINAISSDFLSRAFGAGSGNGTSNYLTVTMPGAPARYTFDAWLQVNPGESIDFARVAATQFVSSGGRVVGSHYALMNYNGVQVPTFFAHNVNLSRGAVPLTEFLKHFLVIRGFGSGVDGHALNLLNNQRPVGGLPSISGLVADGSTKLFPAVQWPNQGGYSNYASGRGIALNILDGPKPVSFLLEAIAQGSAARTARNKYASEIDLAKSRLAAVTSNESKAAQFARQNLDSAMKLIKKGVGDLDGFWNEAVNRYRNIVMGAMRTQGIPGINDAALLVESGTPQEIYYQLAIVEGNRGALPAPDFDLRESFTNMATSYFAEGLALAEYVYTNGLASTVEIMTGEIENLVIRELGMAQKAVTGARDMHSSGAYATVIETHAFWRGIAAGLMELKDRLAAVNLNGRSVWSQTSVQLCTEFSRSCRTDGFGSDHGFNQMVTSVYSGAFDNGPEVVGNIKSTGIDANFLGTQGLAAPIAGYGPSAPTPTAAASTVSQIVQADHNPWINVAEPLVTVEGGKLKLPFGRGKIVYG